MNQLMLSLQLELIFSYITKFSITKNSKVLSEIDFLNAIGLNEIADSLVFDYQRLIKNFNNQENTFFDEKYYKRGKLTGFTSTAISLYALMNREEFDLDDAYGTGMILCGLVLGGVMISASKSDYTRTTKSYPQIQSFLSNQQVKSLSDAYNRKLYNDIAKK
jgi:hypothetical protein